MGVFAFRGSAQIDHVVLQVLVVSDEDTAECVESSLASTSSRMLSLVVSK